VMVNPIKISASLLTKYLEAVGDRMCDMSPTIIQQLAKADKYFKAPPVDKGETKNGEACLRSGLCYVWQSVLHGLRGTWGVAACRF
jgi:hypothetical protein